MHVRKSKIAFINSFSKTALINFNAIVPSYYTYVNTNIGYTGYFFAIFNRNHTWIDFT